jgi:hypothetical protein
MVLLINQIFVDISDFDDRCERVVFHEHDFDFLEHFCNCIHLRNGRNKKSRQQLAIAS